MGSVLTTWRLYRSRIVAGVVAPLLLPLAGAGAAAQEPAANAAPAAASPAPVATPAYDLATCRQVALERQPGLAAVRSSLAAAEARARAVENLRLAALVSRDLPIRRRQASLGVVVQSAALAQAEWDAVHAVTYTYLTAVYARQQIAAADKALKDLGELRRLAASTLESGERADVTQRNVDQIDVFLQVVRGRREEAVAGVERALAALREAMGVGPDCPVQVADTELPTPSAEVTREQVVALALGRRGEVVQTTTFAQATCLEIEAQGASFLPTFRTFASASDIHAQQVPQGVRDGEYRPGGLLPEMPTELVGGRKGRVEQAEAYHARANAVAEKTRNLIALDAQDVFFRWQEASRKVSEYRTAAEGADKVAKSIRDAFNPRAVSKPSLEEVIEAGILAGQLRAQANQTLYQYLLATASLERATAGGVSPVFSVPPAANSNP